MSYNFDWNYISAGAPYVTISENGLGFNSPAMALLDNPSKVVVGFDEKKLTIGIKCADENMTGAKVYDFYNRARNGWVRIGCKDFVKYLSSLMGVSFSPAKRYVARLLDDTQILYINLDKYISDSGKEDGVT